ncbi:type B 50S ribosomal protein L31 [Thiothrix nivea]|uniref:Large ribosomal subunit protein bL31B n=1 Tax=Thiothrix nivea (strain ATCC 35100 / DSM 5205 / JP2) TaxID=870187 RepID=A0A656HF01_THINJ|nr:type B 50S ribosomal protein L31 [Thiothrix nivea]EIJ34933.1 LSU ribosomal protein L31P [Thiothrix nivea DSM 5205]
MKPGIHPNYREVVFQDLTSGFAFLTRSTAATKESIDWEDGNQYPLIKVEISSQSHPFYTGKQAMATTAGRVEKFKNRYARGK